LPLLTRIGLLEKLNASLQLSQISFLFCAGVLQSGPTGFSWNFIGKMLLTTVEFPVEVRPRKACDVPLWDPPRWGPTCVLPAAHGSAISCSFVVAISIQRLDYLLFRETQR
jgi:hypothetical protein